MPYLSEEEKNSAMYAVENIEDKLNAVRTELATKDKSYKGYLLEKLDSIYYDVKYLINICKREEETENE